MLISVLYYLYFFLFFWFRSLSTFYFQTMRNYTIYTKTYTEILFHRSSFKRTWPKGQVNFSYHFIHLKTSSHLIDFIIKKKKWNKNNIFLSKSDNEEINMYFCPTRNALCLIKNYCPSLCAFICRLPPYRRYCPWTTVSDPKFAI